MYVQHALRNYRNCKYSDKKGASHLPFFCVNLYNFGKNIIEEEVFNNVLLPLCVKHVKPLPYRMYTLKY